MAARPLLLLPTPKPNSRVKGTPSKFDPNAKIVYPTVGRQQERLGPKFDRLRLLLQQSSAQAEMALRADPNGIAPERALVFEVAGSLPDFYRQVQQIAGLEFLLDEEFLSEPDGDFYLIRKQNEKEVHLAESVVGRLYIAMPDLRALGEILSLWDRHCRGEKFERGLTVWNKLFKLLRGIRPWGPQDRLLPETLEFWREQLKTHPGVPVRFELELWFYEQEQRRRDVAAKVTRNIEELGGNIIDSKSIADIRYQGMLIDLSPARVQELLVDPTITLARIDDIMYLRPQSLASFPLDAIEEDALESSEKEIKVDMAEDEPIAAMLDGMPLENHVRLRGRLIVDDPDDFAAYAPVNARAHGTGIASLILYGDLQAEEPPLRRKLVVRPVMIYNVKNREEITPPNRLALDVIYQAVRRMLEDNAQAAASAPSVVVINLSLGDGNRSYAGRISPWARLIDWLSFRYRVLFLVSAGNVADWLPLPAYATPDDFHRADVAERENKILEALNAQKWHRTLLSPAEGLNALTVGAWHADAYADAPTALDFVDPFPAGGLPNVSSALGLEYRKSIKPDLLYDSGRELVRVREDGGHVWLRVDDAGGRYAGQLVAAPDYRATGRLNMEKRTLGSSNGTALLTRASVRIYDSLLEAGVEIPRSYWAVLLKALLVHGATWGQAGQRLENLLGPTGRGYLQRRDNVSRFLGYGRPNIDRVLDCAAERATLFGVGNLACDTEDNYDIPLPHSLEGYTQVRRLTITLAWLSPVNPRHQNYRGAMLEVQGRLGSNNELAVERFPSQPTHYAVDRGTVHHSIHEGDAAITFLDGGLLRLSVACRAQAGVLDESIPYALAISIETGIGSGIAVYDEVRAAIQPALRAGVVS